MSFDIETTGLDPHVCSVTCACAYAPEAGLKETFFGPDIPKLLDLMDRAHTLCAFNGARFDIPFLQTRCEIECSPAGRGSSGSWAQVRYRRPQGGLVGPQAPRRVRGHPQGLRGRLPAQQALAGQRHGVKDRHRGGGHRAGPGRAVGGARRVLHAGGMGLFFYGTPPVLTASSRTPSRPTRSAS